MHKTQIFTCRNLPAIGCADLTHTAFGRSSAFFVERRRASMSAKTTQAMNIVKGVGIGMALGAAAGMMLKPQKKSGKRMVSDAMKSIGDMAESISDYMGW